MIRRDRKSGGWWRRVDGGSFTPELARDLSLKPRLSNRQAANGDFSGGIAVRLSDCRCRTGKRALRGYSRPSPDREPRRRHAEAHTATRAGVLRGKPGTVAPALAERGFELDPFVQGTTSRSLGGEGYAAGACITSAPPHAPGPKLFAACGRGAVLGCGGGRPARKAPPTAQWFGIDFRRRTDGSSICPEGFLHGFSGSVPRGPNCL